MMQGKRYSWVLVGLLWMVALLNYMDRQMLSVMRPAMQMDIAQLRSATNFGYLMAIFLWVYGLMSPISGLVADRSSRKWLIVCSLFVWSGVTFAMGYATTFNQVYCLRAIMGISEALYIPAGLSLIADFHTSKTRSLAIGIHMTGFYIGQALGGFGATLAAKFSWQATFHYFGFAGVLYSFVLIAFLKEKKTHADEKNQKSKFLFKDVGRLLGSLPFFIILFYFAVSSLPGWAAKNWLPTLFAQNLNIPMAKAGPYSTIAIAASSLIGVVIGGVLSDKWVQTNIRGRIYTGVIGLGLTIPALLLLGFGHTFFYSISAALCFGLGYGIFDANNMPILCQFVSAKYRATAYGIMNMVGVFSGAYVTSWLGRSSDAGNLGRNFAMLSSVVLIAILFQLYFLRPKVNDQIHDGQLKTS
jgi:ACS family D-galactonate transporter-like MFS transporter